MTKEFTYELKNASGTQSDGSDADICWYELYEGGTYMATFSDDVREDFIEWIVTLLNNNILSYFAGRNKNENTNNPGN